MQLKTVRGCTSSSMRSTLSATSASNSRTLRAGRSSSRQAGVRLVVATTSARCSSSERARLAPTKPLAPSTRIGPCSERMRSPGFMPCAAAAGGGARGDRAPCSPARAAERPCRSCRNSARARLAHRRAAHAGAHQARREAVLGDDLGRQRADAAVDVVRLDRERERDAGERLHEVVRGRGPDARDDHDARRHALGGEQGLGLDRGGRHVAERDERDVRAVAEHVRAAEREAAVEAGDRRSHAREPQVRGAGDAGRRPNRARGLGVVGGRDHGEARQRAQHGDVLERPVRDAVRAVVQPAADADDAHRQVVQHGAVADELVRAQGRERRDRVDERHVAGLGQARRHAHHVLLGDADVEEAIGVALGERLDGHEAEVAGQQQDARIGVGELGERRDEGVSHAATLQRLDGGELGERARVLLVVHRQVVPADLALHERDAVAEHRLREQDVRPALDRREAVDDGAQRGRVVAVDVVGVPAEGAPALLERREVEHVARVAERLLAVDVDDRDEVAEPVVGGEHHRLPDRALVALGVAHEHERAPRAARELRGERRARRDREAVAERAGGEVDAGQDVVGVRPEPAAVDAEARELVAVDRARLVQRGVQREARVALREHEAVALGIVRPVALQHAGVERAEDVRDGQARADVPDVRTLRLLDHDTADPVTQDRRRGFNSRQGTPSRSRLGGGSGTRVQQRVRPAFKPIAEGFSASRLALG